MIAGWQIPLGICAAYALTRLFTRRRCVGVLMAALVLPTTVLIIFGGSMRVLAQQPPLFITADQQAALDWLSANTNEQDVVLSDWRFGNLVPTVSDARVFVGHPIETIGFKEKLLAVKRFFDSNTSKSDRLELIKQWKITLVISNEVTPSMADTAPVFSSGTISVYQVGSP